MLYETLRGSYGDDDNADDTIPRSLGHSIYPETCRRYFALIDSLQATDILRGCRYTDALDNSMATDTMRQKNCPCPDGQTLERTLKKPKVTGRDVDAFLLA